MKAFLLAAGKGTRLRPLTYRIPKCLVPIRGVPLLDYWFDLFEKHGIEEVLINLHHLADKVLGFLNDRKEDLRRRNIKVLTTYEPELLGSAGTILANRSFVEPGEDFLICNADNLTDADLTDLVGFHRSHEMPLTMGLFEANEPQRCGIAELDEEGTVVSFREKPQNPKTNLANGGIYVARYSIFDHIPSKVPCDIGYDLLPRLVGNMKGRLIRGRLMDIGTPESYRMANEIWI
ncbi:TPA: nucleotidyltransferase family protein [Candidatus Poribacteria bacterium]|nr:nucleotidyltransferase family protein [Candidatus Poribacteria bacterium]